MGSETEVEIGGKVVVKGRKESIWTRLFGALLELGSCFAFVSMNFMVQSQDLRPSDIIITRSILAILICSVYMPISKKCGLFPKNATLTQKVIV